MSMTRLILGIVVGIAAACALSASIVGMLIRFFTAPDISWIFKMLGLGILLALTSIAILGEDE